jgi:hypothetical protein
MLIEWLNIDELGCLTELAKTLYFTVLIWSLDYKNLHV